MGEIKGEIERWIYCKTREKSIAKDATEVKGRVLLEIMRFLSVRVVGDMIDMGLMGKQCMTVLAVTSL